MKTNLRPAWRPALVMAVLIVVAGAAAFWLTGSRPTQITRQAADKATRAGRLARNGTSPFALLGSPRNVMATPVQFNTRLNNELPRAPIQTEPDFFPLGVYYAPTVNRHPTLRGLAFHEAMFKEMRDHNVNTVFGGPGLPGFVAQPELSQLLDLAARYDLRLIPHLVGFTQGGRLPIDETTATQVVRDIVEPVKNHRSLLAYYIADEPLVKPLANQPDYPQRIYLMQRLLEGLDPAHPPVVVLGGLDRIEYYTDLLNPPVFLIDTYPRLPNTQPGDFGRLFSTRWDLREYIDLARGNLRDDRPWWNMLRGYGPRAQRSVVPVEIRAQAAVSLALGAKGLFYFQYLAWTQKGWYGLQDENFQPTANYEEVKNVFGRVRKVAPLLLKLHQLEPAATVAATPNNDTLESVVGTFRGPRNALYLIVANTYLRGDSNVTVYLDSSKVRQTQAFVDEENGNRIGLATRNGKPSVQFNMRPGDFRIFRLDGAREARALRSWYAMSPDEQVPTRNKPRGGSRFGSGAAGRAAPGLADAFRIF
ncbi:MAG TPA: hypothetical protein VNA16_10135 [Abditibacteriaceae bacterium]|nr:hypothetical protein [Abditibacteriaceae bacterium]